MTEMLTARQRATPPLGDHHPRRAHSSGGDAPGGIPRTIAPGTDNDLARYPGTVFDARDRRDRTPWYDRDYYLPPAQSWVSWTAAGPARPELHMRAVPALRQMSGNSQSRGYHDPNNYQRGLHTNPAVGVTRTTARYLSGNPQMAAGRFERLQGGQYSGQSYSQTTRTQATAGARGRRR